MPRPIVPLPTTAICRIIGREFIAYPRRHDRRGIRPPLARRGDVPPRLAPPCAARPPRQRGGRAPARRPRRRADNGAPAPPPADLAALKSALVELLELLAAPEGRTDANCTATDYFFSQSEPAWSHLPEPYRALLESLGGTLHDTVHAPKIAANFECLPEQLLERARKL